ncbi:MAG: DUF6660 family protein [Sediminicola sp.]
MKLITVILSFYFLALNIVPCSDMEGTDDDGPMIAVNGFGEEHPHGSGDLCSPFCQCHCCHSHTIDMGPTVFKTIRQPVAQEIFFHFDSLGKDIHPSLFQPPRA